MDARMNATIDAASTFPRKYGASTQVHLGRLKIHKQGTAVAALHNTNVCAVGSVGGGAKLMPLLIALTVSRRSSNNEMINNNNNKTSRGCQYVKWKQ